jgi:signal peptidase II
MLYGKKLVLKNKILINSNLCNINLRILITTIAIILIDQISKLYIKGFDIPILNIHNPGLVYCEKHEIIGSLLRVTFVENPGMAFGINIGISSKLFLSLFSIAASIGILVYLYQNRNEGFMLRFSLALILGGAIGNLIDRVFYGVLYGYAPLFQGKVVDFVDIDFFDINLFGTMYDRWPIFNMADMAVSIGVVLLIFFSRNINKDEGREGIVDGGGTMSVSGTAEMDLLNKDDENCESSSETEIKN